MFDCTEYPLNIFIAFSTGWTEPLIVVLAAMPLIAGLAVYVAYHSRHPRGAGVTAVMGLIPTVVMMVPLAYGRMAAELVPALDICE